MATNDRSPLDVAIIDAFGAAAALKGNRPKTEDGRPAIKYLLPAHQFHKLVLAAVRYGTSPASVNLTLSAALHTENSVSSSLWTAAEAMLHMKNVSLLYGFEVEIIALPQGSFGRFMQLRDFAGVINLSYDEGEIIFHAIDRNVPLITCSEASTQAFRSRIHRHKIEAFELDHSCPQRTDPRGNNG